MIWFSQQPAVLLPMLVSLKSAAPSWKPAMMKAMGHSLYQAYLMNSGLDDTSPMASGAWGEQIKMMVGEFGPASEGNGSDRIDILSKLVGGQCFCAAHQFCNRGQSQCDR